MGADLEVRPLAKSDVWTAFTCGQADLDRYFQHFAGQNQFRHHLSVTYVAVLEGAILGFATVSGASIDRLHLPSSKKRPPDYPLPVVRLARLGVEVRTQKQGIGRALLLHVFKLAMLQRDSLGCVGVVTDAKEDAVPFYARYGFVPLEDVREGTLAGEPVPLFLPMALLLSAAKAT